MFSKVKNHVYQQKITLGKHEYGVFEDVSCMDLLLFYSFLSVHYYYYYYYYYDDDDDDNVRSILNSLWLLCTPPF